MNRNNAIPVVLALVVISLIVASQSVFVLRVDRFAIVTQFGKPVRVLKEPGLYFKVPMIEDVKYLDKRVRGWNDDGTDTKTLDSRQIDYTVYGRWQIIDPLSFYKNAGSDEAAYAGMDSIVTDSLQTQLRSAKLAAIVRETGRAFDARGGVDLQNIFDEYQVCNPKVNPEFRQALSKEVLDTSPGETPEGEEQAMRSQIVAKIIARSNERLESEYGIRLVDLHFKYLNYAKQVFDQIIKEIETDRRDDISSYLEVGKKCVGYINRVTDAERGSIVAAGDRRVRELDGEGTAKAIAIKSAAFQQDPEFYQFMKNLEILESTFTSDTRLVLNTDSPLLKMLNSPPFEEAKK